jgi:hypothetical protein
MQKVSELIVMTPTRAKLRPIKRLHVLEESYRDLPTLRTIDSLKLTHRHGPERAVTVPRRRRMRRSSPSPLPALTPTPAGLKAPAAQGASACGASAFEARGSAGPPRQCPARFTSYRVLCRMYIQVPLSTFPILLSLFSALPACEID